MIPFSSPSGTKIRSKRQLQKCLGEGLDLSCFDFRTGKLNAHLLRQSKHSKFGLDGRSPARCGDINVSPPIRRTASIFKQPVTLIRTQEESKVKSELKHVPQEKPKQIFWEKRLEGIKATIIGHEGSESNNYSLPKNFYAVGPDVRPETALRSLATSLHLNSGPITGQTAGKNVEKKPAIYLDPKQPLIGAVLVNEEDVRRQEERVNHLRRKLANLIKEVEIR